MHHCKIIFIIFRQHRLAGTNTAPVHMPATVNNAKMDAKNCKVVDEFLGRVRKTVSTPNFSHKAASSSSASTHDITGLLLAWSNGDEEALEKLIPIVYEELRRIAHCYMMRERSGHPLQTTALVREAYLRLIRAKVRWQNRAQPRSLVDVCRRGGFSYLCRSALLCMHCRAGECRHYCSKYYRSKRAGDWRGGPVCNS